MRGGHGRVFVNARGEAVPYDGVSPVEWQVAAYVLATREGRVLVLAKAFSGWWGLPGGAVRPVETREADVYVELCRRQQAPAVF